MYKNKTTFSFLIACLVTICMARAQDTPIPATVPYYCGFEDEAERSNWLFHRNGYYFFNKWMIGTATHSEGEYALYVTNNSSTGYTYDVTHESVAWAYRDVFFDPENQGYTISFDFKGMGEKINQITHDYLNVYVGPPAEIEDINYSYNYNPTIDPPEGATLFLEKLCQNSDWTNYSFTVDASFSGVQRIYFMWRNDGSGGTQPPAAIDNISITPVTCAKPAFLTANVIDTTLVLSWLAITSADSYSILYKKSSDSIYIECSSPYNYLEINDFQYGTSYDWKVRSNCADDEYSFWSESTFQTLAPNAHLPYYYGFEDSTENANWLFFNEDTTNRWTIGNATSNGGESALYISNDGGISNIYTANVGRIASYWACRDFYIPDNYSTYSISFDFKGMGETVSGTLYDYMQVFWGPAVVPYGNAIPDGAVQLGDDLNLVSEWTNYRFVLSEQHGLLRLYFRWRTDSYGGTNPPAAVDNIVIEGSTCQVPIYLSTSEVMDSTANVAWYPAVPSASYVLAYKTEEDSLFTEVAVSTNSYHLADLMPATNYVWKVRTLCSENEESIWAEDQMFTTHAPLARLPYSCGFENGTENAAWQMDVTANGPHWQIGTGAHHLSGHALYVGANSLNSANYEGYQYVCYAYRDFYIDPSYHELELSFYHRCGGTHINATNNVFKTFIGPPTNPPFGYFPQGAEQIGSTIVRDQNWTQHTYTIDRSHTGFQRLYFYWGQPDPTTDNPPSAVDDIVFVGHTCGRPTNLSVTHTDERSISIHFSPCTASDHAWEAALIEEGGNWEDAQYFMMYDTNFTFYNLNSNAIYSIYVRTVCEYEDQSNWTPVVSTHTGCGEITELPYTENFDRYGNDNYPWCWSKIYPNYGNYPIIFNQQYPNSQHYLRMASDENLHSMAITPPFNTNCTMDQLIVRYSYNSGCSNWTLSVGVIEDPEDESTFTPIKTIQSINDWSSWNDMIDDTVYLTSYTGNGRYIAFQYVAHASEGGEHLLDIDNVTIDTALSHVEDGIADRNLEPFVFLYPNPANSHINIYIQDRTSNLTEVALYDVNGRILRTSKGSGQQLQISVADLAHGMYFVKIYCGNKSVVKQFVKQ